MQRASLCWTILGSLGLAVMIGCAVGTDPDAAVGESDLDSVKVAEAGDENSIVLPPPSQPGDDAATDEDAGTGDLDGGTKDAAVDAAPDAAPPLVSCTSPNACLTGTDLGSVSGDKNADLKTFQGAGSMWLKVRVTEDDNGVLGTGLEAKFDLTSPTGTNYDLYVYRAGGGSGQECSSVTGSSTSTGGFDTSSMSWGEGAISNGSDDGRTVSIEVRWVSGTCAPASKWTLNARGNTN